MRHHEYLKVDPRVAGNHFQSREAMAAYEGTLRLDGGRSGGGPPRSGEREEKSAGSAGQATDGGVQKPAATFGRNQERWKKFHSHLEA